MIKYFKQERRNPIDNSTAWYPAIELTGTYEQDDIVQGIVEKCTLTAPDVKAALIALEEVVINAVKNGYSVRFGDLGSFRPTLKTRKWSEAKKAYIHGGQPVHTTTYNADGTVKFHGVTVDNIAGLNVVFTKGSKIKKASQRAMLSFAAGLRSPLRLPEQE